MGRRLPTLVVAFVMFDALLASNGPSPLYVIWEQRFGFSAAVVTAVFAAYAVAVLLSLLVVGRLSDQVGRRAVLLPALALIAVSAVLFATARGVESLIAARVLQGFGTGALTGAATAALVELDPARDRRRASMVNTGAFIAGAGTGPLLFGVLVQYLPWPTVLPFVTELALLGLAVVGVAVLPETVERRTGPRLRLQRPGVPGAVLAPFAVAGVTLAVSWSVGALYAALSPSIDSELLHVHSHAAAGLVLFGFNVLGGVAQLGLRRWSSRTSMAIGVALLAVGMALVQLSLTASSVAMFAVGTVLAGIGGGVGFMGALTVVNEVAPPRRRAEVVSAFNLIGYTALAVPVVGVGLLTGAIGLRSATAVFTIALLVVSAVALVAIARSPAHPLARLSTRDLEELELESGAFASGVA